MRLNLYSLEFGGRGTPSGGQVPVLVLSNCDTSSSVESSTYSLCMRPIPADQARGRYYKEGRAGKAQTEGPPDWFEVGRETEVRCLSHAWHLVICSRLGLRPLFLDANIPAATVCDAVNQPYGDIAHLGDGVQLRVREIQVLPGSREKVRS